MVPLPTQPEPGLKGIWLVTGLLGLLPLVAFFAIPAIFFMVATQHEGAPPFAFFLLPVVFMAIPLIGLIASIVVRQAGFKHYSFDIGPDHVTVRRGIIMKREEHIPYARIQDVVVQQGWLLRRQGLFTLQLDTAAMNVGRSGNGANRMNRIEGIRNGREISDYILALARRTHQPV